jgi:hypothetical protein
MLKWILLATSMLLAKYTNTLKNPTINILQQVSYFARRAMLLFVFSLVAAGLAIAGLVISINNWFSQYDTLGSFRFTATFTGGLILAIIGAAIFYAIYNLKPVFYTSLYGPSFRSYNRHGFWNRLKRKTEIPRTLEDSLSLLISDYLREREHRRQLEIARFETLSDGLSSFDTTDSDPIPFNQKRNYRPRPSAI